MLPSLILSAAEIFALFRCEKLNDIKQKPTSQKSQTDWARIEAMTDDDIDFSDIPRVSAEMFAKGMVRKGLKPVVKKQQLTLRIDSDVVAWFKAQGRGY